MMKPTISNNNPHWIMRWLHLVHFPCQSLSTTITRLKEVVKCHLVIISAVELHTPLTKGWCQGHVGTVTVILLEAFTYFTNCWSFFGVWVGPTFLNQVPMLAINWHISWTARLYSLMQKDDNVRVLLDIMIWDLAWQHLHCFKIIYQSPKNDKVNMHNVSISLAWSITQPKE